MCTIVSAKKAMYEILFWIVFSHVCCTLCESVLEYIRWPITEHWPINSHYIASKLPISANYWWSNGEWLVAVKLVNTHNMFCVALIHRISGLSNTHSHHRELNWHRWGTAWHFGIFSHTTTTNFNVFSPFVIIWNPIADTAQRKK